MQKRKILLVDDHPLVRRGIRTVLDGDYTICGEAENGREAIDMAQSLKPDLILMDVSMREIGGIEATREIRRLLPKTKILILSMHDGPEFQASAKKAGADRAITKTTPARELLDTIASLLKSSAKP